MSFVRRFLAGAIALLGAALLWWYPEPALFSLDRVDWAGWHEDQYTPSDLNWGYTTRLKTMLAENRALQSLPDFIAEQTRDRTLAADGPEWDAVFDRPPAPGEKSRFVRPANPPFDRLSGADGFIERRTGRGIDHLAYHLLHPADYGEREIPPAVRYPFRRHGAFILAGLALVLAWSWFLPRERGILETSSAGRVVKGSLIAMAVGAFLVSHPFVYRSLGSGLTPPSLMVGLFVTLGGVIGFWFAGRQVLLLKGLVADGGHLAHFTYTEDEWARFVQFDHLAAQRRAGAFWLAVLLMSILVGFIFLIIHPERAAYVSVGLLLGLVLFIGLLVIVLARTRLRRNLRRVGEAYIGRQALYVNGMVHSWGFPGGRLESVEFLSAPLPHIAIAYSQWQSAGAIPFMFRRHLVVRVLAPSGREDEARTAAERMGPER